MYDAKVARFAPARSGKRLMPTGHHFECSSSSAARQHFPQPGVDVPPRATVLIGRLDLFAGFESRLPNSWTGRPIHVQQSPCSVSFDGEAPEVGRGLRLDSGALINGSIPSPDVRKEIA
jgi:hypothetical protein